MNNWEKHAYAMALYSPQLLWERQVKVLSEALDYLV